MRQNHQQLHKTLIDEDNTPCAICGSVEQRDIHRLFPDMGYVRNNVEVLCEACHQTIHYQGKFGVGDRVCVNGRTPQYVDLRRHTPRTITGITYNTKHQCNFYRLGMNNKGNSKAAETTIGESLYRFRSYMLLRYTETGKVGRPAKAKRSYTRKQTDTLVSPDLDKGICATPGAMAKISEANN